ncbi:MAG: hypothetical protein ACLP9K_04910 [Nitrososphaerales archaeon]
MNILVRVYLFLGLMWLVGTYAEAIFIRVQATREGLATGVYLTKVYTNGVGENYLELGLFLAFLPAIAWVFASLIRRLFVPKSRS